MKRILLIAVVLVISISLFAQKDVTKFLGIPIDGFKPEMIQKLKEKGFNVSEDIYTIEQARKELMNILKNK